MVKAAATGIAVGLNKGHIVTNRPLRARPSRKKGKLGVRTKLIREVIAEVAGLSPLEKRGLELQKIGTAAANKRTLKLCTKRYGTLRRGKKKREMIANILSQQRKKQQAEKDKEKH